MTIVAAFKDKNAPDAPQTGDNSRMGLWFTLTFGSLTAMFAILFGFKKKKKAEDK